MIRLSIYIHSYIRRASIYLERASEHLQRAGSYRHRCARLGLLFVALTVILAGCAEPSLPPTTLDVPVRTERLAPVTPPSPKAVLVASRIDAQKEIETALQVMEDATLTKSFWYTGYIRNTIHKRKTTSMFSGTYLRPERTAMDARMAAIPYRFYRDGEKARYIWTAETDWLTVKSYPVSVHPFASFSSLLPYFNEAEQWDDEVLGMAARAYRSHVQPEVFIRGWDAYLTSNEQSVLGTTLEERGQNDVQALLTSSDILLTLWLQDDPTLHKPRIVQLEAIFLLPIPAAGYSMQEVFFRFYQFNDPSIKLKPPSEIERYLKDKDEELQK